MATEWPRSSYGYGYGVATGSSHGEPERSHGGQPRRVATEGSHGGGVTFLVRGSEGGSSLILSSSVIWPRLVRHPAALPEEKSGRSCGSYSPPTAGRPTVLRCKHLRQWRAGLCHHSPP